MSITIRSMIDPLRRWAACQPPNRRSQPAARLFPQWNAAPGSRLTRRWTRLTLEALDDVVQTTALELREIPRPALFLAAKAFAQYRRRGGGKAQVLPDFFIGVHAAVEGWPLLTRAASRFRTYFPTLQVLAP